MKLRLIIAILSIICLTNSCTKAQEPPVVKEIANKTLQQTTVAELNEEQAIAFAEKFIAQNGYTDLSPNKENLVYESIEWESNGRNAKRAAQHFGEKSLWRLKR